jgi:hypothetical protein
MTDEIITCPKCDETSGNAWEQCGRSCPMPGSPKYDPNWKPTGRTIVSAHHGGRPMPIRTVLLALAGQENCDGSPYDEMIQAAEYIAELEAENAALRQRTKVAEQFMGWEMDDSAEFAVVRETN